MYIFEYKFKCDYFDICFHFQITIYSLKLEARTIRSRYGNVSRIVESNSVQYLLSFLILLSNLIRFFLLFRSLYSEISLVLVHSISNNNNFDCIHNWTVILNKSNNHSPLIIRYLFIWTLFKFECNHRVYTNNKRPDCKFNSFNSNSWE